MQNGMYKNIFVCCVMFLGISASSCEIKTASKNAVIYHDSTAGPIDFAAQEIREALEENGFSVTLRSIEQISSESQSVRVILTTRKAGTSKQSCLIRTKKISLCLSSRDIPFI
jgi:hypothetical protein